MKLCKDCKFHAFVDTSRCLHHTQPKIDPVDGFVDYSECYICRDERRQNGTCGPDGRNFLQEMTLEELCDADAGHDYEAPIGEKDTVLKIESHRQ